MSYYLLSVTLAYKLCAYGVATGTRLLHTHTLTLSLSHTHTLHLCQRQEGRIHYRADQHKVLFTTELTALLQR